MDNNNNNEIDLIDLIFDRRQKKFIASHDNEPEQSDNDTPTGVIADDNVVTSGTQQLYPSTPSTRGDNTPLPTNNNVSEVIADDNNDKSNYGIPADKYERLAKHFTPEEIEYFYNFNPQNDNFLTDLYKKNIEKPVQPDEKQIKRNRLWGIIGEGLGLVSQVASHGSGAYMRERQPTAIDAIDKRQQQLHDLYLKQRDRYEQGLFNAGQQDYLRNLQRRMRGRQQADALYNNQLKLEHEQEKARQALEYKLASDADAMKFKEKELEERKRANRASEADKAERRRMYNDRYISGGGAGTAANKGNKRIDIKAHENDNSINTYNNAVTGEKSRFFNLNESQVTQLATEARRDDEFVEKHQNVLNRMNFDGMTTWDKDNIIATAYAQWLYDKLASQGIIVDDNFNRRSINENITSYAGRPYLINDQGKFGGWVDEKEGGTTITADEVKQARQESEDAQQQQESVGSSTVESQVQAAKSVVVKPDNRVIANDNSSSNSNQSNNSDKSEKEDVKITDNEPATTGDDWIDSLVIGEIDAMDLIE